MELSYTPSEVYSPNDTVSEELLKSIPKKVHFWLQGLLAEMTEPGGYGMLRWNFTDEVSTIAYGESDDSVFQLWWEGDSHNPIGLCGNDKRFESIIDNMDFFTLLEENIYSELESLEEERDR